MSIIFILVGLVALDVAAVLWGADSRERFDSPEWGRRSGRGLR